MQLLQWKCYDRVIEFKLELAKQDSLRESEKVQLESAPARFAMTISAQQTQDDLNGLPI